MAYEPINWLNKGETGAKPINKKNLNHMEKGIIDLQNIELIALSEQAPNECKKDEKYYNVIDKLIYTSIEDNTWDEEGETPLQGVFYLLLSEQSSYYFDGTTMISVGGGKGNADLYIQEEEPEGDGNCIWINPNELLNNIGSEVVNSVEGNETDKSPSVYAINKKVNGKVLYSGEGNNGEVPLNDNIYNYKEIEIKGYENMSNTLHKTFKCSIRSGTPYITISGNTTQKGTNGFISWAKQYDVATNKLVPNQYNNFSGIYFNTLSVTWSKLSDGYDFFVYEVIGYK